MKKISIILLFLTLFSLKSCMITMKPCPPSPSFAITFVNSDRKKVKSPYSKVYEKSVFINIDSIRYTSISYLLPLPSVIAVPNPKTVCFIFEKPNGQKDSVSIEVEMMHYRYESRRCGLNTTYKSIKIVPNQTSFPTTNILNTNGFEVIL